MGQEKREQPKWIRKIIEELNKEESQKDPSCMDIQNAEADTDI
jgi:hypothetical protein